MKTITTLNTQLATLLVAQLIILLALFITAAPAQARPLTQEELLPLVTGDNDSRIEAISAVVANGDEEITPFLNHILNDEVVLFGGRVLIIDGAEVRDAASGETVAYPDSPEEIINNNRMRAHIEASIAALRLASPQQPLRLEAARTLKQTDLDASMLPLVKAAEARESDETIQAMLSEIRARIELTSGDRDSRLKAAQDLSHSVSLDAKQILMGRLDSGEESDEEVKAAIADAIAAIDQRLALYEHAGTIFSGISLGSVLLLAALGLAITYGLMGVINMAHGEMIMLGAYATYIVQNLFRQYLPGLFEFYVLAAIPVAFLVTALIGMAMERGIIRHLYGRPLETLLATWGISLILMQLVRTLFGAQNVMVENPSWLSGGLQISSNLVLPYNRIAIIIFSLAVLFLIWVLLNKSRLGLFVRAVTQNRTMAGCVGVNTARIDSLAFALGSGVAGLAGVALAQVGNVGPDLGKTYIVDSFLVVVMGGVGQLAGTVYAALSIGVVSKFMESFSGAVVAKIIVLLFIIIFIQKRPQGIFAPKGRSVE